MKKQIKNYQYWKNQVDELNYYNLCVVSCFQDNNWISAKCLTCTHHKVSWNTAVLSCQKNCNLRIADNCETHKKRNPDDKRIIE